MWGELTFANPEAFYLLILIPILGIWYIWRYRQRFVEFKLPTIDAFNIGGVSWKVATRPILFLLRLVTFAALIIALARPQSSLDEETVTTEGIDIVIANDVSLSMLTRDLKPNRLEASKTVAADFIKKVSGKIMFKKAAQLTGVLARASR